MSTATNDFFFGFEQFRVLNLGARMLLAKEWLAQDLERQANFQPITAPPCSLPPQIQDVAITSSPSPPGVTIPVRKLHEQMGFL